MFPAFPASEVDRVQNDAVLSQGYSVGPAACTYYYGFNVEKEPFTSANIRRAFSMAIDRQDIIDNILKGGQISASFFSRPNLVAAPNSDDHADLAISFDPAGAQEALVAGLADLGLSDISELPPITLMHNESESHRTIAEAIQDMWAENLGVEVEISSMEWAVYLDLLSEDAPQIYRLAGAWTILMPITSCSMSSIAPQPTMTPTGSIQISMHSSKKPWDSPTRQRVRNSMLKPTICSPIKMPRLPQFTTIRLKS